MFGMGITDGNLLLYNGNLEQIKDNKILMREYNIRAIYDWFINHFLVDFYIPDFNLTPMSIADITWASNISCYTPDPPPYNFFWVMSYRDRGPLF